jgi:hypothetical protein
MEQYKELVSENWKWSIFHKHVAGFFRSVGGFAFIGLIAAIYLYTLLPSVKFDFSVTKEAKPATAGMVTTYLTPGIEPVRIPREEIEQRYFSATDLPQLVSKITEDLNKSGSISIEHIEIAPREYLSNAQKPDFIQIKAGDDIIIFSSIVYEGNRLDRFVAIARKFDKWRLSVIKGPGVEKTNMVRLPDTSEKIYELIK